MQIKSLSLILLIVFPISSSFTMQSTANLHVIDVGVNLTHRAFRNHWRQVVQRSIDANANTLILTGTSVKGSADAMKLAQTWWEEKKSKNLYFTVGVHPHDAKSADDETLTKMKQMLQHPLACAVGECGLDFNRNFSPRDVQVEVFRQQVQLACTLRKPLFVHEREAHQELLKVLDQVAQDESIPPLPPILVHCFTGTEQEALEYIRRGYYIGFTGTICKKERGAPLRAILPKLPLDRIMIETDAPFMGFQKGRRGSEPSDVVDVARRVAETVDKPFQVVCGTTTGTARSFFGLDE